MAIDLAEGAVAIAGRESGPRGGTGRHQKHRAKADTETGRSLPPRHHPSRIRPKAGPGQIQGAGALKAILGTRRGFGSAVQVDDQAPPDLALEDILGQGRQIGQGGLAGHAVELVKR